MALSFNELRQGLANSLNNTSGFTFFNPRKDTAHFEGLANSIFHNKAKAAAFIRPFLSGELQIPRAVMPHFRRNVGRRSFSKSIGSRFGSSMRNRRGSFPAGRRANMPTRLASSGLTRARVSAIGRQVFNKEAVFPQKMTTKLVTSTVTTVTLSASTYPSHTQVLNIDLNSAIDPINNLGSAASAQQPMYFDQLKALYNVSTVTAAKITIQLIKASTSDTFKITSNLGLKATPTTPSDEQATSDPQNTMAIWHQKTGAQGDGMLTITRYVNMSRFFGRDVKSTSNFDEAGSTKLSATEFIATFIMHVRNLDETNFVEQQFSFRVQLTQWIQFKERIKPAAS